MNPTWIRFVEMNTPPEKKTKVWAVQTSYDHNGIDLGEVKFWPKWRKYTFFPLPGTLYEQDCLRDIANFCDCQTAKWRASLKARP